MRRLIYHALSTDLAFMALLPGGLHGDRALTDTPDVKPFGVLMHEGPQPGMSRNFRWRTTLWVHGNRGDYTRIDDVLLRARARLIDLPPFKHANHWLIGCEWEGVSGDLLDDDRGTNVKNSTFLLVGNAG